MSSTVSNYDMRRLTQGIAVTSLSLILALWATYDLVGHSTLVCLFVALVTVPYAIMMFASSFVEEEQHFWYWVASAWLAWLFVKQWVTISPAQKTAYQLTAVKASTSPTQRSGPFRHFCFSYPCGSYGLGTRVARSMQENLISPRIFSLHTIMLCGF